MYPCCYYLSSYLTLLTLHYGGHMERGWVARKGQKRRGYPSGSQNGWWTQSSSWMSTPGGVWEFPTGWWCYTKCSSTLQGKGRKRWNACSTEANGAVYLNLNPGRPIECPERKWETYTIACTSLRRSPESPSCGQWQRRRAIHDILPFLTIQLHRQMHPAKTKDMSPRTGGCIGLGQQESYEAALWVAHHRVLETTKALQSDLKRLRSEQRRRSWARSQSQSRSRSRARSGNQSKTHSRTQSRTCSRGQSRNHARPVSQSCHHGDLWGVCPWSPDGPMPRRRVSFHNPNDIRDPIKEAASCSMEPSVDDLETWLEVQARQLGTPRGGKNWELCLVLRIGASLHRRLGHRSMFQRSG